MHLKGIALSTIAYMILALITIIVIVSLIGNKIYPSLKEVYCNILTGVRGILPLPDTLKTDVPTFCKKETDENIKTVPIESRDPDRIAFTIAAYIEACWEKTGKIDVGENVLCYEVVIKDINGEVNEALIKNYVQKPFTMAGSINKPTSVAIIYNSENKIIQVI